MVYTHSLTMTTQQDEEEPRMEKNFQKLFDFKSHPKEWVGWGCVGLVL